MPHPIEHATPTPLARLTSEGNSLHGRKVRIAGWYLACDTGSLDIILVGWGGHGVLVDISACLGGVDPAAAGERGGAVGQRLPEPLAFLREGKKKVMVMGVVDAQVQEDDEHGTMAVPKLGGAAGREAGDISSRIVLRAVLIWAVDGLDFEQWEMRAAELESVVRDQEQQ